MFRKSLLIVTALLSPGIARAQDAWRDTAHHRPGFVTVQQGVLLHYLDFGGSGPPLILLAGLGNTAHAWDDFAPAFTDRFHVVAITRRGFGESAHPNFGYDTPRLVADILAVMDSLRIPRASFIGHSIAGEEMTRLGAYHARRVEKLVYLDGAYDRVRANILVGMDSVPEPEGEKVILPTGGDTLTPAAYVAYVHKSRGVNVPEADIRTRFKYDGWREELTTAYSAIDVETPEYKKVRAPSLAIYAVNPQSDELYSTLREEFRRETPNGQVIEIRGAHHWIFVSHAKQVIERTREFLLKR